MTETFKKNDGEKNRLDLLQPDFIEAMGWVLTFGARKYSPDNWKKGTPERYRAALLRHTFAYLKGELLDPESGLPHLAMIGVNAMFLSWFESWFNRPNKKIDSPSDPSSNP